MDRAQLLLPLGLVAGLFACGGEFDALDDLQLPTWEEYRSDAERFLDGKVVYVIEDDIRVASLEALADEYQHMVEAAEADAFGFGQTGSPLTIAHRNGSDVRWSDAEKRNLTYCVDPAFGSNYSRVVSEMARASRWWEAGVDIDFRHASSQDSNCRATNGNVVFAVRPATAAQHGIYGMLGFFPDDPVSDRTLWANVQEINSNKSRFPVENSEGLFRHELGHILGFRHEHIRGAQSKSSCRDRESHSNRRDLTDRDSLSVMNYAFCSDVTRRNPEISLADIQGAAKIYGGFPRVALRSDDRHFMWAQNGGGGGIRAKPYHVDIHEMFFMRTLGSKRAFVSFKGYYMQANSNGWLHADGTSASTRAKFTLVNLSDGRVALKTYAHRYVVAEGAGGGEVNANRTRIGSWEKFDLVRLDDVQKVTIESEAWFTQTWGGRLHAKIANNTGSVRSSQAYHYDGDDQDWYRLILGRGDLAFRNPEGYYPKQAVAQKRGRAIA